MREFLEEQALLQWDGFHLAMNLGVLERKIQEALLGINMVSDVHLSGWADVVLLEATLHWKGLSTRVRIEIREIRLRFRRLGFRLGKMKILGGMRIPRSAIESIVEKAGGEFVRVFRGAGIVVVDLRDKIPPELELRLLTIQVSQRKLEIWLGPGLLHDIPAKHVSSGQLSSLEPKYLPGHSP